jgi:hypothetical protein
MKASRTVGALLMTLALLMIFASALAPSASAQGLQWRLEQPHPPIPPTNVPGSETPIGLGRVGDVEFTAPNRGLLITDGNGSTIPAGVWDYNGQGWHELADVCGATDGRIAWAGPEEFWTVSDGRPGQAANGQGQLPPLEDDTLCHFAFNQASGKLEVIGSYAAPAFQASSYQPMDAAACTGPSNCWFAGSPLPAPQPGAFHLHWTGSSLEAQPNAAAHAIGDMNVFEGRLLESLSLPLEEPQGNPEPIEILHPFVLNEISSGATTFAGLRPRSARELPLPEYAIEEGEESFPPALGPLQLSSGGGSLWAAAGPASQIPKGSLPGQLTVLRDSGGVWSQVLGPETENGESKKLDPPELAEDVVNSIAAEPSGEGAWLALDTVLDARDPKPTELATVAHVTAEGTLAVEQLPSAAERAAGVAPKGAAAKIACPAQNDCWLVTTQGWLFHLSEEGTRTLPTDEAAAFNGSLLTFRPEDEGLPQVQSDAPPSDDSGLEESVPPVTSTVTKQTVEPFATVAVPLLTDLHTKLVHGTTLQLSFHLAVKARVRLLAKRHAKTVASTPTRTLNAGKRVLELRLNRRLWPTKLDLETHALAPLPTVSTRSSSVETVSTSLAFPDTRTALGDLGPSGSGWPF